MLWGWPFSTWELIIKGATAIAAVTGVIAAVSAFIAGYVGFELTDAVQRESDSRILAAQAEIEQAKENVAKANERVANAEERILTERRLTANERWRLERVERAILPRNITPEQFAVLVAALKGLEPVNLAIIEKPEPKLFGLQLLMLFKAAGWEPKVISLPADSAAFGVTTYRVNENGEKVAETLWRTAQIGGGWIGVRQKGWGAVPENENCVIVGENNAAMQPGNGQPGEGIDEHGDPVPAPQ